MPTLRPWTRYALLALAAAGLASAVGLWLRPAAETGAPAPAAVVLPEPRLVPELGLVDQHGRPFDNERLRGRWSLVFFGYTRCPDVCPATLASVRAAWPRLAGEDGEHVQMLFISVDPDHDTPAVLARFLEPFPSGFVGLTGDRRRIEGIARALGVATGAGSHAHAPVHGGQLLVIGPDVRLRAMLGQAAGPELIAGMLAALRRQG